MKKKILIKKKIIYINSKNRFWGSLKKERMMQMRNLNEQINDSTKILMINIIWNLFI